MAAAAAAAAGFTAGKPGEGRPPYNMAGWCPDIIGYLPADCGGICCILMANGLIPGEGTATGGDPAEDIILK